MGRRRDGHGHTKAELSTVGLPFRIIQNEEHYREVVEKGILRAKKYVKIATANVKDLRVRKGKRYHSIVREFGRLVDRGVSIRILHGGKPSGPFRESLAEHPALANSELFEMMYCPRTHMKIIAVDGNFLYTGSANMTGAGLGVKNKNRRNLEVGLIATDAAAVVPLEEIFDTAWSAAWCDSCARKEYCE